MLTEFTFFFDDGATETECFPLVDDLQFNEEKDDDFGFFRRLLETELIFSGADYTYLKNIEDTTLCTTLDFIIRYKTVDFFTGIIRFGTDAFSWDEDNCHVRIKLSSNDNYTCLTRNWKKEINILSQTAKVTVQPFIGDLEQIQCSTARLNIDPLYNNFDPITDCITAGQGWTLIKHEVVQDFSNGRLYTSTYVREKAILACDGSELVTPPGDGWILVTNNCPTNSTWARAVSTTELTQIIDPSYVFLEEASVLNEDLFDATIDNGVLLKTILETFNPCDQTIISDFFGINPDDTAPSNDYYAEALENLQEIVVFQKSDIKRYNAGQNATNGRWTYKGVLDALRLQTGIEIRITDTDFRIEHGSYFDAVQGDDLTVLYPVAVAGQNKYEYISGNAVGPERWAFMEEARTEAQGVPIEYDCFGDDDPDSRDYTIQRVNNDFTGMIENPDAYADDGFCFVATKLIGGQRYIISEINALTDDLVLNGHMLIPNLQDHYLTYARPLPVGEMNLESTVFVSPKKQKQQVEIKIPMKPDVFKTFDASELVKSGLGWGEIQTLSYSCKSRILSLILLHE